MLRSKRYRPTTHRRRKRYIAIKAGWRCRRRYHRPRRVLRLWWPSTLLSFDKALRSPAEIAPVYRYEETDE